MLKKSIYLLLVFLGMIHNSCKKESNLPGIKFFPLDNLIILNESQFSGVNLENNQISFYANTITDFSYIDTKFSYQIKSQDFSKKEVFRKDPKNNIEKILSVEAGIILAFSTDSTQDTLINGLHFLSQKIVNMNKDGKVTNSYTFDSFGNYIEGIITLTNGNIILQIANNNSGSIGYSFYCFNNQLQLQWLKEIGFPGDGIFDIMKGNNSFYVLFSNNGGGVQNFSVHQYDLYGNLMNSFYNTIPTRSFLKLVPSKNGFLVMGYSFNAASSYRVLIASFDVTCNHLQTKYLDESVFTNQNENIYWSLYNYITSNVIYDNGQYYFVIGVLENNGTNSFNRNKFIRMNEDFEVEIINTIEQSTFNEFSHKYLVLNENNFVLVNSASWNMVPGISFTTINKDGKILN